MNIHSYYPKEFLSLKKSIEIPARASAPAARPRCWISSKPANPIQPKKLGIRRKPGWCKWWSILHHFASFCIILHHHALYAHLKCLEMIADVISKQKWHLVEVFLSWNSLRCTALRSLRCKGDIRWQPGAMLGWFFQPTASWRCGWGANPQGTPRYTKVHQYPMYSALKITKGGVTIQ